MLTQITNGKILTPGGWTKGGSVIVNNGKILAVTDNELSIIGAETIDAKGMYIVPGFIAMNVYGGGGRDFRECEEEAFRTVVSTHLKYGATSIFPTLATSPAESIYKAVGICEKMMKEDGTQVMGLHLAGPYLNHKMSGPIHKVKNPDKAEYTAILESTECIKRWDISPELPGAHELAKALTERGILATITHTEAEFEDIKAAHEAGFTHTANFYNSMPGFHKRQEYKYEGTVESVYLIDDMTVEVIADGHHLPHTILKMVYKLKGVERTCLVTDALLYAGSDIRPAEGSPIIIEDGVCKLADHSSLVGSIATMDVLIRTMVNKAGIPLEDAVRMASETPARIMRISDRKGSLEKGKDADIVILDNNLNVRAVWSQGNLVPGTDTLQHN